MAGHVTFDEPASASQAVAHSGLERLLHGVRKVTYTVSSVALLIASAVMTYGVAVRHFAGLALDWQDEVCIFLLVGATFLSAASVQARRGHVGIEAIAALLSPRANHVRRMISDLVSFLFCSFFTWKAAALLYEAWEEGQTSQSTWAPPMWIPYLLMSLGMLLLTLQLLLQFLDGFSRREEVR